MAGHRDPDPERAGATRPARAAKRGWVPVFEAVAIEQVEPMSTDARALAGSSYLDAVTRILHRQRLADPTGGLWEAADLHWWWRKDRHEDPDDQRVWFDDDVPVAAASFTGWGDTWGADLIGRSACAGRARAGHVEVRGCAAPRRGGRDAACRTRTTRSLGRAGLRGSPRRRAATRTAWMDACERPQAVDRPRATR